MIGIIGGTGLDDPDFFTQATDEEVSTPYGQPSSTIRRGKLNGADVALLARHGHRHTIPPTHINNRANIHALKELGCTHIIASAACGSLRDHMGRGDLVIPDQFIDFTRRRVVSFYDHFAPGVENARHAAMADPFDEGLRQTLREAAQENGLTAHPSGTLLTIEGNRFSTRAESNMFRMWGADLVNMTIAPEVILANEAGLRYAAIAMVTDFDCWKTDEPPLRVSDLVQVFTDNVAKISSLMMTALAKLAHP